MGRIFIQLRSPAIISTLLVLPLVSLEVINRRSFAESFPVPLFGTLWLLSVAFLLTLMPVVRTLRAGDTIKSHRVSILARVAFLILVAWLWVSLLLDQMPCFLGVPNCD
jgi:cation transport ATPase